jgi:hypothetical protein
MDSEINRLGFDAWADNKFVDAIETYVFPGEGWASHESDSYSLTIRWNEKSVTCTIRAHTTSGWQVYEKQTTR